MSAVIFVLCVSVQRTRWTWRRRFYCKKCRSIIDLIYLISCVRVIVARSYVHFLHVIDFCWVCRIHLRSSLKPVASLLCPTSKCLDVYMLYVLYRLHSTCTALHDNQLLQIFLILISDWYANWARAQSVPSCWCSHSMTSQIDQIHYKSINYWALTFFVFISTFFFVLWGQYDHLIRNAVKKNYADRKKGTSQCVRSHDWHS